MRNIMCIARSAAILGVALIAWGTPQDVAGAPVISAIRHFGDDAFRLGRRILGHEADDIARQSAKKAAAAAAKQQADDLAKRLAASYGDDLSRHMVGALDNAPALASRAGSVAPAGSALGQVCPGLTEHVLGTFGDDTARFFTQHVRPNDAPRLAAYLGKADSPATRAALLKTYQKTGGDVLNRLDWKVILATGLTISMITGTHEIADGVQNGLATMASESPEVFGHTLTGAGAPVMSLLKRLGQGIALCLVMGLAFSLRLPSRMIREARRIRKTMEGGDRPETPWL